MKYRELKLFLQAGLISNVRVLPFTWTKGTQEKSWCIDVLIKPVLETGANTDVLESDRSTKQRVQIRRFASIDSAAKYLRQLGVSSFVVDLDDTISFAATTGVTLMEADAGQTTS
ncbi:MAG: hypothetical protein KDJ99_08530, partial [Candidatus Competibacteraceae bacterium]|nr:hypothetical protein [Candidatus Competibacteraceae bacterium]